MHIAGASTTEVHFFLHQAADSELAHTTVHRPGSGKPDAFERVNRNCVSEHTSMNHEVTATSSKSPTEALLGAMPTLLILALLATGWLAMHRINNAGQAAGAGPDATDSENSTAVSDTLTLPEGKLKAGGFASEPVHPQDIQNVHTVPGRLRYDATKHVSVQAPIDGVLSEFQVKPGDEVQAGDVLATVRSAQIGQARAEVLHQTQQLKVADQLLEREQTIAVNLQQLSAMLKAGKSADEIESYFGTRSLGTYRQQMLAAYGSMQLAAELVEQTRPLAATGAIAERTLRERENERQLAETSFRAAYDEATFAADQAVLQAQGEADNAQRQVDLAWQSLEGLLGVTVEQKDAAWNENALSTLQIRAPFAGTIESCTFARNERVIRGDDLLILANTDTLYVEASIRESNWAAVTLQSGTQIDVMVPAMDDQTFQATVQYVGREVDAGTNSVPLVATIDNSSGLFRPGMFVRVTVPIGSSRRVLSVAPGAVMQHENRDFVFVDLHDRRFQRVDVSTGESSGRWVEVKSGLAEGQLVVTKGAFLLKSELLLQGED